MSLNTPNISELRAIVDWANMAEDVRELSIKFGDVELFISRNGQSSNGHSSNGHSSASQTAQQKPAAETASISVPEPAPVAVAPAPLTERPSADELAADEVLIKAPMVGVFYASPKPGAASFVSVGDKVGDDTVLGIVEVMKLMNNIQARVEGVITKILVSNEQAVEYGQPLMVIKRNG
jgi:acetyl-CoA carboxylase biotin carboxyl carrier protein